MTGVHITSKVHPAIYFTAQGWGNEEKTTIYGRWPEGYPDRVPAAKWIFNPEDIDRVHNENFPPFPD